MPGCLRGRSGRGGLSGAEALRALAGRALSSPAGKPPGLPVPYGKPPGLPAPYGKPPGFPGDRPRSLAPAAGQGHTRGPTHPLGNNPDPTRTPIPRPHLTPPR
ncbi:hypothetical protein GCM10017688_26090 [Streptomyces ramulosus]